MDITSYLLGKKSGGGGGGSTGDFEYEGWIAYGSNTPDASKYKYWFPVDTTPEQKPLKLVAEYNKKDYFTGELKTLVENGDISSSSSSATQSQSPFQFDSASNKYFRIQNRQGSAASQMTIYTYTYTGQKNAMKEFLNNSYISTVGKVGTLFNTSQSKIASALHNNKIYAVIGNNLKSYNLSTSEILTEATDSSGNLNSYTNNGYPHGLFWRDNGTDTGEFLYFVNYAGNLMYVFSIIPDGSATTYNIMHTAAFSVPANNDMYAFRYTNDKYIFYRDNSGTNVSLSAYKHIYIYDRTTNTTKEVQNWPYDTGYIKFIYTMPDNSFVFRFSENQYELYTLDFTGTNPAFKKIEIGNLFSSIVSADRIGSLTLGTGDFYGAVPANNFSIKDTQGNNHTGNFDFSGFSLVKSNITTNYNTDTQTIENYNSSNNVLLLTNFKSGSSDYETLYTGYKFLPKKNSGIYLSVLFNSQIKFIYNQQKLGAKISINNEWVNADTDSSNYINYSMY